ncbi:MAG: MFS transporter [Devosiaceae bacterium]
MRGITEEGAIAAPVDIAPVACSRRQQLIVLTVAILGSTLGFIDGTIVAIIAPAIRADLGASLATLSWVVNGYTLVLTAFILVGGSAGDVFGRRRVFGAGIAVFAIASLGCALVANGGQLITARALQGFGAALMVPSSLALIATYYPREERGRAVGIWAAASGVSAAIGPILGGALVDTFGWRSTFYINLPIAGLTLWLLWAHVPDDAHRTVTQKLDWVGALLAVAALGLLAFSLTLFGEGGELGEAISLGRPVLLGLVVLGLVAAGLFLWHEGRTSSPMMPLSMFAKPGFGAVNAATFLLYAALGGLLFFLPVTLLSAYEFSALAVGSVFLPFTVVMALITPRVGALVDKIGVRLPLAIGAAIAGVSFWLTSVAAGTGSLIWVGGSLVVLGIGMGLCIPPLSTAIINAVSDAQSGVASGINNAVSRAGGLFAVAAFAPLGALAYGNSAGLPGFAVPGPTDISAADQALHTAATLNAYSTLSYIALALGFAGAALVLIFVKSTTTTRAPDG